VTWFNYTPLAPLIEKYSDDGSRDLFTAECDLQNEGLYRVTAIGDHETVQLIRVQSVNSDGSLTPEQARTVSQLVDHMISVLRFTTDQHVEKLWFGQETISFGSHGDAKGNPKFGVSISLHSPSDYQLDFKSVADVYSHTVHDRDLFKLLGDSQHPSLPLQYRYLSLYKILEHEFRIGKKWPDLRKALAPWDEEFRSLKISSQLLDNFIHDLRDRCAHIRIGNSGELGLTGLSTEDTEVVEKVVPIIMKVVQAHLSQKYPALRFHDTPKRIKR
jgi:hypothetical protein